MRSMPQLGVLLQEWAGSLMLSQDYASGQNMRLLARMPNQYQ